MPRRNIRSYIDEPLQSMVSIHSILTFDHDSVLVNHGSYQLLRLHVQKNTVIAFNYDEFGARMISNPSVTESLSA